MCFLLLSFNIFWKQNRILTCAIPCQFELENWTKFHICGKHRLILTEISYSDILGGSKSSGADKIIIGISVSSQSTLQQKDALIKFKTSQFTCITSKFRHAILSLVL